MGCSGQQGHGVVHVGHPSGPHREEAFLLLLQIVSGASLRGVTPLTMAMGPQKRAPVLPFHPPPTPRRDPAEVRQAHVPSAASRSQSAQVGVGGSRHRSQGRPSSCPREKAGQAGEWGQAPPKGKALNQDWRGPPFFQR